MDTAAIILSGRRTKTLALIKVRLQVPPAAAKDVIGDVRVAGPRAERPKRRSESPTDLAAPMDQLDAWLGTSLGPENLRAEVRMRAEAPWKICVRASSRISRANCR